MQLRKNFAIIWFQRQMIALYGLFKFFFCLFAMQVEILKKKEKFSTIFVNKCTVPKLLFQLKSKYVLVLGHSVARTKWIKS